MALAADMSRLLFISYAGKDAAYLAELETHLAPLVRRRLIAPWHAGLVGPGQVYHEETAARLAQADLILILVSPDYLAADGLYEGELGQALRRHDQGTARVIPITLRPAHQPGHTLTRLQALPRSGQPISQWADRDAAWTHVVTEIAAALASLPSQVLPPTLKEPPPKDPGTPPAPPDQTGPEVADLAPGSVLLHKYRIANELGRGGMGRVLLAERAGIGGHVAVKVLLPEFSRSAEMAHRFFNEARAVNAVGHPGLVQVFDHGQLADGSAFLVMEYLDGESLGARLRRDPHCLRQAAQQLGWQLASILAAVHARGIVHRDLKPDNVVLVRDSSLPGGARTKVLDFGIAKVARENSLAQATRAGAILGTPEYMSPEQCRDSGSVTDKTDVYALGVMLYQFLSGQVPFADPNWMAVVTRQLTEAPRPLSELAPGVDRGLAALVQRMLDKDPQRRPSMAEVAAALEQTPRLESQEPKREGTRRWALLGLVGAAAAAGLVALLGVGHGNQQSAGKQDASPRDDSARRALVNSAVPDLAQAPLQAEEALPIYRVRGQDAGVKQDSPPPIWELHKRSQDAPPVH